MIDPHRRTALKTIGSAGLVLAIGGVGTVAARNGRREGASADPTIYEIAAANDDFDTLVGALDATGLDAVLDGDDGQYTVFAPTDDAFVGVDLGGLDLDELEDVLLYHVTNGRRYAASVVKAPRIEMLNSGTVTVDGTALNVDQAEIVTTDIEASNGLIHAIDGVLLP